MLVRGVHHYARTDGILVGAHLVHVNRGRRLQEAREVCFAGARACAYLAGVGDHRHSLPWDQRGYWARRVESGIIGMAAGIGGWFQQMIQGRPELGAARPRADARGARRDPPAIVAVLFMARASVARKLSAGGSGDPYSKQLARNLVVTLVVLAVLRLAVARGVGRPGLDAPADASSDYPARRRSGFLSRSSAAEGLPRQRRVLGHAVLPQLLLAYVRASAARQETERRARRSRAMLRADRARSVAPPRWP